MIPNPLFDDAYLLRDGDVHYWNGDMGRWRLVECPDCPPHDLDVRHANGVYRRLGSQFTWVGTAVFAQDGSVTLTPDEIVEI